MKKTLLYPYTKRALPLVRFWNELKPGYPLVLSSFSGSGLTGKKAGRAYEYTTPTTSVYTEEELDKFIDQIGTCILLPVEQEYDAEVVANHTHELVEKLKKNKIEILNFTNDKKVTYPFFENSSGVKVRELPMPVIFIGGLVDSSRSFETFCAALVGLQNAGIQVCAFSTYKPAKVFGVNLIDAQPSVDFGIEHLIKSLNMYIYSCAIKQNADVVLLDLPSPFLSYSNLTTGDFGVYAYILSQAVPPDCILPCAPLDCFDQDIQRSTLPIMKYRFGQVPCGMVYENCLIDYLNTGRGGGLHKLFVAPDEIANYSQHLPDSILSANIADKNISEKVAKLILRELEE